MISDVTVSERWLVQLLRGVLISFMRSKGPEEVSFAWMRSHTRPWDSFMIRKMKCSVWPGLSEIPSEQWKWSSPIFGWQSGASQAGL